MDELDQALLEAWYAVSERLKKEPWALARRMERVSRKELRRPVRAWCVALRRVAVVRRSLPTERTV